MKIKAYDPAAMPATRKELPQLEYCDSAYSAADGAHGVVILTEWNLFRALELDRLKELLLEPLIVDTRNIYEPAKVVDAGFTYVSVGRPDGRPEREEPA